MLCSLCCTLQYETHLNQIRDRKWLKKDNQEILNEIAKTCRAGRKAMRLRTSLRRWHEDHAHTPRRDQDERQIAEVVTIRIPLWQLIASAVQEFVGGKSGVLRYGCEAKSSHDKDKTSWDKANGLSEDVNTLSTLIKEKKKQIKKGNKILEDEGDCTCGICKDGTCCPLKQFYLEDKLKAELEKLKDELKNELPKLHQKQPRLDAAQNEVLKKHLFSFVPEKGLRIVPPKEGGNGEPYVLRKLRQVFASCTCT